MRTISRFLIACPHGINYLMEYQHVMSLLEAMSGGQSASYEGIKGGIIACLS